jgi:hypothetical protein
VSTFLLHSVDPGKQTGYGWLQITDGVIEYVSFLELPWDEYKAQIDVVLRGTNPAVQRIDVYCEKFIIGSNTHTKVGGGPYYAIEQIGVLRHLCEITGHHFDTQGQSDAKGDWSDAKLKKVGWWIEGNKAKGIVGDHARDAAKHMLLAIQRHHMAVYFDLVK